MPEKKRTSFCVDVAAAADVMIENVHPETKLKFEHLMLDVVVVCLLVVGRLPNENVPFFPFPDVATLPSATIPALWVKKHAHSSRWAARGGSSRQVNVC